MTWVKKPSGAFQPPSHMQPTFEGSGGTYEFNGVLGSGGPCVVYRAVGPDGRDYAVKMLRKRLRRPRYERDFEREIFATGWHSHPAKPNFVEVVAVPWRQLALVTEIAPGVTFEQLGEGAKDLDETRIRRILIQICEYAEWLHLSGVLHRDLSPANVMIDVDQNDRVSVLDLGFMRAIDEGKFGGGLGFYGTIRYLAPEIVNRADTDRRCDVYSVGCLLHFLVRGEPPISALSGSADRNQFIAKHRGHRGKLPDLADDARIPVSESLRAIAARCIEYDKEDRYPSMTELLEELRAPPL